MVYQDLRKDLDYASHKEVLFQLWSKGITDPLRFWFGDYLFQCHHFVRVDGVTSKSVPGSTLRFLVYVNDLPDAITKIFHLHVCYEVASWSLFRNGFLEFQDDLDTIQHWGDK